jgi:hypothetical protein
MITISVLGLDQYVVGHYSKDHTANVANLLETDEDSINFFAPESVVFHNGVEQTSWNTIVVVRAPQKYNVFEKKLAEYLLKTLSEFSINLEIQFEYFEEGRHYERLNPGYPRFIAEDNLVNPEVEGVEEAEEDEEDEDEPDPRDRADLDINDENQLYLGDALQDFDKKIASAKSAGATKKSQSGK